MFRTLTAFIFVFVLCASVAPQNAGTDAQALNAKIAEMYSQGKLDEAVPLAEELVKLQRGSPGASQRNLVSALETASQIKLSRFKRTAAERNSPGLTKEAEKKLSEILQSDGKDVEEHLREAATISKTATVSADQGVNIRGMLAWILYRYSPPFPRPIVAYDKVSRDKLETQTRLTFQKRSDEAASVLKDAVAIAEADAAASPTAALIVALYNLAEFEMAMSNFEDAVTNYEKCIAAIKVKSGKYAKDLLVPLAPYAKVLAATNQEAAASEAVSLMVRISGQSMAYPKELLNLSYRTDKSFAPYLGPSVIESSTKTKERADFAGRRVVAGVAAAGGDALGASLATSTLSRDYYDYSGHISVVKILVKVAVDENGSVTEAEAMTNNAENRKAAEKIVREWKFRPYLAAGRPAKMVGYVECRLMLTSQ